MKMGKGLKKPRRNPDIKADKKDTNFGSGKKRGRTRGASIYKTDNHCKNCGHHKEISTNSGTIKCSRCMKEKSER